jgi:hypothetical protein
MLLQLRRLVYDNVSTIGKLSVDGLDLCDTLEDVVRAPGMKIPGETAIPYGKYKVTIDWSNRFQRLMPHILNVPNFAGIRIHWGNWAFNTEGCLLIGHGSVKDEILNSKIAFNDLWSKLKPAIDAGQEVWVEVTDGRPASEEAKTEPEEVETESDAVQATEEEVVS